MKIESLANPAVLRVKPYVPGKPLEEVAKQFRLKPGAVDKMASNENPLGPSPKAVKAIRKGAAGAHLYPDGSGRELREKIARRLGIVADQVILGNGSNEVLEFLAAAFLQPGDTVLTAKNTFSLYETFATMSGAETITVPLRNFEIDPGAVARRLSPRVKLVFLCNPNNPTGSVVPHRELRELVGKISKSTVFVLDEAYGDFRDDGGFEKSLEFLNRPNVILLRTFSKLFGLAGLRIGYGIANAGLIGILNRVRQPFNTNRLAQAAALASLGDVAHEKKTLKLVADGKKFLCPELKKLGLRALPTQANFVCVETGNAKQVFERMQRAGIIIRPLDSFGMPEWIRVTIGTRKQNMKFVEVLNKVI